MTEYYKTRRRHVGTVIAGLVFIQIMWALWAISRWDAQDLMQGWMYCMYQFPLLNCIMMPVIVAIVASKLCDVEHKGQTFKLLETAVSAGRVFDAKFLYGTFYMFVMSLAQVLVILIIGHLKGFPSDVPFIFYFYYFLFTFVVSSSILLLQQILSLLFVNQMIALTVGIVGGFLGLFSMFFSQAVQKLVLWGYYGVLMFVGMDWDRDTRISEFYWTPIHWSSFFMLILFFCVLYWIGRILFQKKEM